MLAGLNQYASLHGDGRLTPDAAAKIENLPLREVAEKIPTCVNGIFREIRFLPVDDAIREKLQNAFFWNIRQIRMRM